MKPELQQLKDIHLPVAIHNWPLAPGWIVLFILLLVFIFGMYSWYCHNKKRQAIKFALCKLKKLKELANDANNDVNVAAEISTLIRRTGLCYFPRETIASLSGQAWLAFLNRTGNTQEFKGEVGQLLIDRPYRKDNQVDLTQLFVLTEEWLKSIAKKSNRVQEK